MGMSVSTGGGVKAEPNVVPMIDVLLVLLIIFMVVTPAIAAGFTAEPPSGINLKAHPEQDEDQVLGIDKFGNYFLNKQQIPNEELPQRLRAAYSVRASAEILYLKPDKDLESGRILEAMDSASKTGVRMVGGSTCELPGRLRAFECADGQALAVRMYG